jgi:uncharacterized membrane protein YbhN (UPF0104 family)
VESVPPESGSGDPQLLDEESLAAELADREEPAGIRRPRREHPRPVAIGLKLLPYAFVVAMILYLISRRDDIAKLGDAKPGDLALIAALVVVGFVANATEYWVMYRASGIDIGFGENQALFNAGQLGNYLPMQAGTLYRFRYLKVVHGLRYANTASYLIMNLALTLGSTALCGLIGLAVIVANDQADPSWILVVLFVGLLAVSVVSALVPLPTATLRTGRIWVAWAEFHRGWETVRRRPLVAFEVLLIDTVKLVLLACRFAIAFRILGVHAPIGVYLVVAPVTALVAVLAPTPGALGIREGSVAVVVALLGYSVPTGLLAATIDRVVMLVASCVLGSIGYVVTGRRMRATRTAAGTSDDPAPVAPGHP